MPFYTGPYGCYVPLRSSIGVGPRGDSVTVKVVTGDDGSCVLKFINASTGEVIETTPDLAFTFDDFTPEQLEALRADVATVYYRKDDAVVRTSGTNTTTIQIPFDDYRDTDMLFVSVEGLSILQGTDYVISDGNIVLSSPIMHDGTAIEFTRMTGMAFAGEGLDDLIDARIEAGINSWLSEHPGAIGDAIAQTAAEAKSIAESAESHATYAESVATSANDTASAASQTANAASQSVTTFEGRFPEDYPLTNCTRWDRVNVWFRCINGVASLSVVGTIWGEETMTVGVIPSDYVPTLEDSSHSASSATWYVPATAWTVNGSTTDFSSSKIPALRIKYDGTIEVTNSGGSAIYINAFTSWPVQPQA